MTTIDMMQKRIKDLPVTQLKEIALETYNDYSDEATIIFEYILAELIKRMPEKEFVAFCDNIE